MTAAVHETVEIIKMEQITQGIHKTDVSDLSDRVLDRQNATHAIKLKKEPRDPCQQQALSTVSCLEFQLCQVL